MTATGQNFEMHQGDRKQLVVEITDENEAPINLGSYDEITWVAYHPSRKSTVLTKTLSDGITVTDVINGVITIDLLPVDTLNILPNIYAHECELSDGGTNVSTVFTGSVKIIYSQA